MDITPVFCVRPLFCRLSLKPEEAMRAQAYRLHMAESDAITEELAEVSAYVPPTVAPLQVIPPRPVRSQQG